MAMLPKREFRGAWLHIVGNWTIREKSSAQVQDWIAGTLDSLKATGCNAVFFQVRPQADAFYFSRIEPWSRFLTGEQGKAPEPFWDPLQFAIDKAHALGMELHAWLNPYRVTGSEEEVLCEDHLYFRNPSIFLKFGKQLYFDPAEPESREQMVKVVKDIVRRYDVDGIHLDDYFYPYPIKGSEFPDTASFRKYAAAQGFSEDQKADWRRNNVTVLMRELSVAVKSIKPWVRFGVSPFGIHRNKAQDPQGSNTNGLSNYDQLYADVPLWLREGIVDYNVPQIYWKIGHPLADYETLVHWWNDSDFGGHLYIGQAIRTFSEPDLSDPKTTQMARKMALVRDLPNVHGNVWWPGWSITDNVVGIADSLRTTYQRCPSLIPVYSAIDSIPPAPVSGISSGRKGISWTVSHTDDPMQEPSFYIVYRCAADGSVDIDNPENIVAVTRNTSYLPSRKGGRYVVTVTDHCWNESLPSETIYY